MCIFEFINNPRLLLGLTVTVGLFGILFVEISDGAKPRFSKGYCSAEPENRRPVHVPSCAIPVNSIISQGGNIPGSDGNFLDEFPEWFDADFAAIGQRFARRNTFGIYYSMFLAFIFFIGDPEIRRVLINTGNVGTPEGAAKRYLTNLLQTELWYNDDIQGNATNLFQSLNQVRTRHVKAVYRSTLNESILRPPKIPNPKKWHNPEKIDLRIWNAFEADLKASNIKKRTIRPMGKVLMNQHGMANTLFLHFGLPVIAPKAVFIPDSTPTNLEAYMHLWAFFGKGIGMEDEYNVALQPDFKTGKAHLTRLFYDSMVPLLFNLDYEAKVYWEYFFKGLNNAFSRVENEKQYNWINDWNNLGDVFLLRLLEDVLKIPTPNMRKVLTGFERGTHAVVTALNRRYKTRTYQNGGNRVFARLLNIWGDFKLKLDTNVPSQVAEKGFVK